MGNNFIKVRSVKDIILSLSIILVGVILVIISVSEGANMGGYALIILGAVLTIFLKSGYCNTATKKVYNKKEFLFAGEMRASIVSALKSNPELIKLSESGKGQVLKLIIFYSKSSGNAFVQLYEYVPYEYKACTDMYDFEIGKVSKLL